MSQTTQDFTRALYTFDAVVRRVPADKWDSASTCEGWSLRDVLKHQCGVLDSLAEIIKTGEMVMPDTAEEADNPVERWEQTRDNVLTAMEIPGALEKEGAYWFGPMPVEQLVGMVKWDPLTHAWDIGKPVGLDPHMPEDLVQKSLDQIIKIEEAIRAMKLIDPAIAVADDAPVTERYLAFLGRQP